MSSNGHPTPEQKMQMHLRMLYSDTFASSVATTWSGKGAELSDLIATFDLERLAAVREERLHQLAVHCRRQCPVLWKTLDDAELARIVRAFADSPRFWEARGRSLAENFCLFAHDHFRALGRLGHAELVRLAGTVSGLSAAPGVASPWDAVEPLPQALCVPGVTASEAFFAHHALVDELGALHLGAALSKPVLTFVLRLVDRSLVAGIQPEEPC